MLIAAQFREHASLSSNPAYFCSAIKRIYMFVCIHGMGTMSFQWDQTGAPGEKCYALKQQTAKEKTANSAQF